VTLTGCVLICDSDGGTSNFTGGTGIWREVNEATRDDLTVYAVSHTLDKEEFKRSEIVSEFAEMGSVFCDPWNFFGGRTATATAGFSDRRQQIRASPILITVQVVDYVRR
jgi:hypothetical protein